MARRDVLNLIAASVLALLVAACESKGSSGEGGEEDNEEKRDY